MFGESVDIVAGVQLANEFTEGLFEVEAPGKILLEIYPKQQFSSIKKDSDIREKVANELDNKRKEYNYTRIWLRDKYVIVLGFVL